MKLPIPIAIVSLLGMTVSLLTGPAARATEPAPDTTPAVSSVEGRFVGQAFPSGSDAFFAVGGSTDVLNPARVTLHATLDQALAASGRWTFPSVDASGPVMTTVGGVTRCLQPDPSQAYKYVYPAVCTGSTAQQWGWEVFANDRVSGYGLVSNGGAGGFLRQFDGRLAVGGFGSVVDADRVTPEGLDPVPVAIPVTLEAPTPGSVVREPRPVFSGRGTPDAVVEVLDSSGGPLATATVTAEGTWSAVPTRDLAPGAQSGTVRQRSDDSTANWSLTYRVVTAVTVRTPALDATVDDPRPVFSGLGEPGARVTVLDDTTGVTLVDVEVDGSGAWSQQSLRTLEPRAYTATATQVFGEQRTTAPLRFTYREPMPEPGPVEDVTLLSPAIGETIETADPVFSGRGEPGATIRVIGAWGTEIAAAEVGDDHRWAAPINKSLTPGRYSGGSVRQEIDGVEQSRAPYDFTVAARAVVAPLVVESPASGGVISSSVPVFSGTAQPGARLEIWSAWGDLVGTTEAVAASGRWTISWNKSLLPARYAGGTVRQIIGGVETHRSVYDFTVASVLRVTSPRIGDTLTGTRPVFTGTATPLADIEIIGAWGTRLGTTKADSSGSWTVEWSRDYLPGRYQGGRVEQRVNGTFIDQAGYDFRLVR
ncbi:hypothetical protein BWO91_18355 [Plantibacter flavus]|uniref:hypothetical protein n=1 Tax=Plantibacter flavus TaxID=150123 RepID=UPI00099DB3CD|nr:hypothetical protein [Plantibacter flavus]AQX81656.1 hypothetical protein BWO91_18355 [Plantibacter flavus]